MIAGVYMIQVYNCICVTGVYFACVMIMCTISVTTTVVVLNFHHRSPEMYEMPGWVGCSRFDAYR